LRRHRLLFAARVRARKWAAARPAVIAVVAALVVATGCWIALGSGVLDVRHVDVVGASKPTTAQIDIAARSTMGASMLTVDTSALRRRVSTLPTVTSVRIARVWPNTLRVSVTERRPVLAVQQPNGWLLIDSLGLPYLTVGRLPARVLPLTVDVPKAGDPALRAAVSVVAALPSSVHKRVTAVLAPSPAGIRLRLSGDITVVWGGPEDSVRKARALAVLLHRHAKVYDVSTPGVVTTS
jgi:cell division protein FtsQ